MENGFITLAAKLWGRRGSGSVPNQLLAHCLPTWKLNEMSFHQKSLYIYGSALSMQYMESSGVAQQLAIFNASHPRVRAIPLTDVEFQLVQMCLSIFQEGIIVAVPNV